MSRTLKRTLIMLLAAAYAVAMQGALLSLVSCWYSTGGEAAVAMHTGSGKEPLTLGWTQRAHLPLFYPGITVSAAVVDHTLPHPVGKPFTRVHTTGTLPDHSPFLFSELCNKAPPTA